MDLAIYQLTRLVNSVNRKGGTKIERNRDLRSPYQLWIDRADQTIESGQWTDNLQRNIKAIKWKHNRIS